MAKDLRLICFLALTTFLTRIVNLLAIPIFTDEAIYIRWAQIGLADPAHRYISLTDGKQPLLTWAMYPLLTVFPDPLFAGRMVSVIAGVLSAVGIYLTARELFGRRVALFATILYIVSPFTLIYDRLAVMDSLLASLGVWSLYFGVILVRQLRLDASLLYGATIGLSVLTKSSGFFYLYLTPLQLFLFGGKKKVTFTRFAKWIGLGLISFVIVQVMYNSLRLSPWFYLIKQKNYTFIYTFAEFLSAPFAHLWPNFRWLIQNLVAYITIPVSISIVAGILYGVWKKDRAIVYLFLFSFLPILVMATFGKVLYPRFILYSAYPLFIIAAVFLVKIVNVSLFKRKLLLIVVPLILAYPSYQSYLVLANPVGVDIPVSDRNQLFDDWPSGYGVREVIAYIGEKSKLGKVVVGTEGTFGLFPAAIEIYLGNSPNVEIHGFWPVSEVPAKLLEQAKTYPTYLVFKEKQVIPANWPLTLIAKYRRGRGDTFLYFFQVEKTASPAP